jgi:hypothetical protein
MPPTTMWCSRYCPALAFLLMATAPAASDARSLSGLFGPDKPFFDACQNTGVKILNAPTTKVSSISLDWNAGMGSVPKAVYRIGFGHGLRGYSNSVPFREMIVSKELADVLVTRTVSDAREILAAPVIQKLVRYTLTATDQRDGLRLGTMEFAVDMVGGYACGANVGDTINIDAFLRQVTALRGEYGLPNATAPVHQAAVELLGIEEFSPMRIVRNDEWSAMAWDKRRRDLCESMVPRLSPNAVQRRFSADATGLKRLLPALPEGFLLCDSDGIISGAYLRNARPWAVEIDKYALDGTLIYKMKFEENPALGVGAPLNPTIKSQDGYLLFDWWNGDNAGQIKRLIKVRVREPRT